MLKRLKFMCAGVAAGLALLLASTEPALAWGNTWMGINLGQIISGTRGKSGALRYNTALLLDNAGHDSDIYYGYFAEPVPDYTFTAGLNFRVFLPIKQKVVFDISGLPQYVFYLRTKNERALNGVARGQVHFTLDKVYVQMGGAAADIRDRLSPELNARVRHTEATAFGLFLWQLSRGTSLAVQYRKLLYRYPDEIVGGANLNETLSRDEDYVNARTYLQQESRTRFYLDGEYGSYSFKENISRNRDSRSYGAYAGAEFLRPPAAEIQTQGVQGRISLGYKVFDILDPQAKDNAGFVGNSTIAIGIFKATALQGFFARDVQFSAYSSITYYLETTYGGGIAHYFSRRILLSYDLSFLRINYPEVEGQGPAGPTIYRYGVHSIRLLFRLQRNLELSLFSNLGRRTSNLDASAIHRNFFGISLIYGTITGENPLLVNPVAR